MVDKKKDFLKILGNNIKKYRDDKGLSQEALANLCGWNTDNARSTISKIEKGTNDVPTSKLKIIAEKLGVSVCDLMDCSNIQEQSESVELVKQVYDEETKFVISSFIKLDAVDRIKVIERINTLLDDEKYSVKKAGRPHCVLAGRTEARNAGSVLSGPECSRPLGTGKKIG